MKLLDLIEFISCLFGFHELEIRESEIPWTKLCKRKRCCRENCNYVKYYGFGNKGWYQYKECPTTMLWGPKVNFDKLDEYCKDVS